MNVKKNFLYLVTIVLLIALVSCTQVSNPAHRPDPIGGTADPVAISLFNYEGLEYADQHVLAKYTNLEALERFLQKEGLPVLKVWDQIGWASVGVPAGMSVADFVQVLMKQPSVMIAQPDFKMEAPTPTVVDGDLLKTEGLISRDVPLGPNVDIEKLWGMFDIRATEAWEETTGSDKVILAIIDTGFEGDHPEFADATILGAFDATGEGQPLIDLHGHGTHVAGTAGANGRGGELAGVVWDSPIMPVRVMNEDGTIYTTYLIDGTIHVADYVQDNPEYRAVINMSIGGRGYNFIFKEAIDYAVDSGVVFVTSAGNDVKRVPSYPTAYNGVIAVAATTPTGGKADFSTTGPWTSVGAPGVEIYSSITEGAYDYWQGTSMASPHVAGAAAMLLAKYPNLTPIQVKNQLEETARAANLSGSRGNPFNEQVGYGIIDTVAMLAELKPLKYGSLSVKTNIIDFGEPSVGFGVVIIFDLDDNIVSYGTTGTLGDHYFDGLLEGLYRVQVTYFDPFTETYTSQAQWFEVHRFTHSELFFAFDVAVDIELFQLYQEDVDILDWEWEYEFVATVGGLYLFQTSEFEDPLCDTMMYLFDEDEVLLASNDDAGPGTWFSEIMIWLPAGTYTVLVEEWAEDPLNFTFTITEVVPVY